MSFPFPDEIIREICLKCHISSVAALARSSKALHELVQDENIWKFLCMRDGFTQHQAEPSDWRAFYIKSHCNPLRGRYVCSAKSFDCDFDVRPGEVYSPVFGQSYRYDPFHDQVPFLGAVSFVGVSYLFVSVNALYPDCPIKDVLLLVGADSPRNPLRSYVLTRKRDSQQEVRAFLLALNPLQKLSKLANELRIPYGINSPGIEW